MAEESGVGWRDALKSAAARRAAPAPAVDPAGISPRLAELTEARAQLEAAMKDLSGQADRDEVTDPRWAVEPLAERRRAYQRWEAAHDEARTNALRNGRAGAADPVENSRYSRSPRVLVETRAHRSNTAAGTPIDPRTWAERRDYQRAMRSGQPDADTTPPALLDRTLARQRAAEKALGRPRTAMADTWMRRFRQHMPSPDEAWERRAQERIPGLSESSGYAQRARRLLTVTVGTLEEVAEKSDRLRAQALEARNLAEAATAKDETRRVRAIERLKARREFEAGSKGRE